MKKSSITDGFNTISDDSW